MDKDTTAARMWRYLREAGVIALYGDAGRGLPVTAAAAADLASTLVAAHERVHRSRAASWSDGVLTIGSPAPDAWTVVLDDVTQIADLLALAGTGTGVRIRVDLDPDQPAGPYRPLPARPAAELTAPEERLDVVAAADEVVVLAGPGVVTARAVPALHAFATAGWLGVLNTWGAKGVFPWPSVHHWATIGLQRDDFTLGGLPEADLIVGVGLDPAESPDDRWQVAPHLVLDPAELGGLAQLWERKRRALRMPPLRDRLAAATQAGWQVGTAPLPPARVTQAYGAVAAAGGLVAADPGTAGFWVARTVATTLLDSVIVPAGVVEPGFAIACALVARIAQPGRPVLAVLDAPLTGAGRALLDLAWAMGRPVPVEIWGSDGPLLDAGEHSERLRDAVFGARSAILPLVTDAGPWLERMVDAAGPVAAWSSV